MARGIRDERVLEAINKIPREVFVAPALRDQAYSDHPLNIGDGQTISQPYIVAHMSQALELTGDEKILEIGTGSGYQTAILLELAGEVYSIERNKRLGRRARRTLYSLGYDHFHLREGDGTLGWPEAAPFDAILVTAGSPDVPQTYLDQLADGGRLLIPSGSEEEQEMIIYEKNGRRFESHTLGKCRFVRLIGQYGWPETSQT